ncbi:enhanced intracellular survival protein Eis [Rhodococcus oxybenzonivorans]|uniref:enhanced intracellular survival protein Eis n=1 Tax=Rhodococcus oxybenzonivorans TaxID=1990687 RepID=UPI00295485F2|nr:enhanced intracellular survival protein Eis [Rhodococcus oxybenzonivorans]MDV7353586.1 enhanced intracellular survival protein Eis [Rhodococcus oxybenzonivorans]
MTTTTGGITIRTATEQDWPKIVLLNEICFATPQTPELTAFWKGLVGADRPVIALDGAAVVGATMDIPMTVTVPGGVGVPAAGITAVTVAPTHRRRGILRALYTEQHARLRRAGVPLSILTASEGGIYGRFGYGPATVESTVGVDRRFAALHPKVPDPGGVRMVRPVEARPSITDIYDRWQRRTPGAQVRPDNVWDRIFADPENERGGGTSLFGLLHDDGYVLYRCVSGEHGTTARVQEFRSVTDDSHIALWRTLLGLDLIRRIEASVVPDDPLPYLLTDSRLARTTSRHDELWVRIMDVPAALEARVYRCDLDVVMQVDDGFLDAGGRFALRVRDGRAVCTRTEADPQVVIALDVLGSLYLGAHRARAFAAANRLWAVDSSTLDALDRAFGSEYSAQMGWGF